MGSASRATAADAECGFGLGARSIDSCRAFDPAAAQDEPLTTRLKSHSCYWVTYSDSLSAVFTVRDDYSP